METNNLIGFRVEHHFRSTNLRENLNEPERRIALLGVKLSIQNSQFVMFLFFCHSGSSWCAMDSSTWLVCYNRCLGHQTGDRDLSITTGMVN